MIVAFVRLHLLKSSKASKSFDLFCGYIIWKKLYKGFIHDLIHRQWNFVSKEQLEKIPALQHYYCLVNEQVAERVLEIPQELLEFEQRFLIARIIMFLTKNRKNLFRDKLLIF